MPFTPISTSLGALLLYQGSYGLLQNNGRVFGISSLLSGCVGSPNKQNVPVVLGMISSIVPVYLLAPSLLPPYATPPATLETALALAGIGFLVGWGTKVIKSPTLEFKLDVWNKKISSNKRNLDIEWQWMHVWAYALRCLPTFTAVFYRNWDLLYNCTNYRQPWNRDETVTLARWETSLPTRISIHQ